jgi:hypothetical protein
MDILKTFLGHRDAKFKIDDNPGFPGRMATLIKNIAKNIVGEIKSSMPENKKTWMRRFRVVANRKKLFKLWRKSRNREVRIEYENICKIVW